MIYHLRLTNIYSTYRYYWLFMSSKNSKFHMCISKLHHFCIHLLQKRSGELQKDCKMDFNICHLLSKYWSSRQQILSVNKYDIKIYSICSVNITKDMLYRLPPLSNGFFPVVIYFFPKSLNLIMSSNIFHQYFFIKSVLR